MGLADRATGIPEQLWDTCKGCEKTARVRLEAKILTGEVAVDSLEEHEERLY